MKIQFILWIYTITLVKIGAVCGRYLFVTMEERINATGTLKKDWCTDETSFKNLIGVTLYTCGEECMRRTRCQSVLYHKEMKFCRLRSVAMVTPLHTASLYEDCWSSDISTWDNSILGRCAPMPCDEKSRCYLNFYEIDRCEFSECLEPPTKLHSHFASMTSDVGSLNAYFCDKSFIRVGTGSIICNGTSEWTYSDVICEPR